MRWRRIFDSDEEEEDERDNGDKEALFGWLQIKPFVNIPGMIPLRTRKIKIQKSKIKAENKKIEN